MSETRTNGLSLVVNNSRHIAFNADVTFAVEQQEDIPSVHVADAVYTLILDALKKQAEGAHLLPGDYRLVLTGVATNTVNPVGETDDEETTDGSTEEESSPEVPVVETGEAGEAAEEETAKEEEA